MTEGLTEIVREARIKWEAIWLKVWAFTSNLKYLIRPTLPGWAAVAFSLDNNQSRKKKVIQFHVAFQMESPKERSRF